jgi:hypothetical protein
LDSSEYQPSKYNHCWFLPIKGRFFLCKRKGKERKGKK